ncbi:hypothetical protein CR513_17839, partial [Mucuna pruriens]
MDKTQVATRYLISNMAGNMQQFGVQGGADTSKAVNEVSTFNNLRLENQLTEITSLVRKLIIIQHQQVVQCTPTFCQQSQQLLQPQQNSSLIEDLVKQMSECKLQFQQNITTTIYDLKMQVGQMADMVSQM